MIETGTKTAGTGTTSRLRKPKTYGYIRVSSKDQNEVRQIIAMKEQGIEKRQIFIDKQSGKDFERANYVRLVDKCKCQHKNVTFSLTMVQQCCFTLTVTESRWRL